MHARHWRIEEHSLHTSLKGGLPGSPLENVEPAKGFTVPTLSTGPELGVVALGPSVGAVGVVGVVAGVNVSKPGPSIVGPGAFTKETINKMAKKIKYFFILSSLRYFTFRESPFLHQWIVWLSGVLVFKVEHDLKFVT